MIITIDGKRWLSVEGMIAYIPTRINVNFINERCMFSYSGVTQRFRKEVSYESKLIMETYKEFLDNIITTGELYDHPARASYLAINPIFGKPSLVRLYGDRVHIQYPDSGKSKYMGKIHYNGLLERMQLESDKILDKIRVTKMTTTKGLFKYAKATRIAV